MYADRPIAGPAPDDGFPPPWPMRDAVIVAGLVLALSALDKALLVDGVAKAVGATPGGRTAMTLLLLAVPAVAVFTLWRRRGGSLREAFALHAVDPGGLARRVGLAALAILAFNAAWVALLQAFGIEPFGPWVEVSERLGDVLEQGPLAVAFVAVNVVGVAPFTEELAFRGIVQSALVRRLGTGAGIALTAVVFAAFHFDPYRLVPLAFTGFMLGWVAWRSRSVTASLALHVLINALSLGVALAQA